MATIQPPRRGRPAQHPIDALRTRLWLHVVKLRSGLPTAYAIEEALEGRPEGVQVWRPRKWDGYDRGLKVPSTKPGKPDPVALAEAHYPGTAMWFHSPIWPVLRREPTDVHALERALRSLDAAVVELLFVHKSLFETDPPTLHARLLQREDVDALAALGTFDALVAMVLLVAQSNEVTSPELREWALDGFFTLQPAIADAPETCLVYPELFTYIDRVSPHWVFPAPNQRMLMHVFWHERARQSWAEHRMPFIDERIRALRRAEGRGDSGALPQSE